MLPLWKLNFTNLSKILQAHRGKRSFDIAGKFAIESNLLSPHLNKMTRCTAPAHELWLQPKVAKADRKMSPPSPHRTPNLRFGHFLQLGGSKWTEVVQYEQGVPLGRSGHPTCLYSVQNKIRPKMGPQILRNWGRIAQMWPLQLKWGPNMFK